MFTAKPHPLLVPFDGPFDIRKMPTGPGKPKDDWKDLLEDEVKALGESQYRLYADGRYAVLLVFQALDAAGKDSTIRHVFAGVNPCGLHVASFKEPSKRELAHDFLWRATAHLPERGSVAIFNRSYYEEVLVVRVHPKLLAAQKLAGAALEDVLGGPLPGDRRLRAVPGRAGDRDHQILAQHVEGRAAQATARAHRRAREELEVQLARSRRAGATGRVPGCVRGLFACDVAAVGAVVCRAGRQQALRALASREARQRSARRARRRVSAARRGGQSGPGGGEKAARERGRLKVRESNAEGVAQNVADDIGESGRRAARQQRRQSGSDRRPIEEEALQRPDREKYEPGERDARVKLQRHAERRDQQRQ